MIDLIFVIYSLSFFLLFLIYRKPIFNSKIRKTLLLIYVSVYFIHYLIAGELVDNISGFVLTPVSHILTYLFLRAVFFKKYHREPKDSFWVFEKGYGPDATFNIIFCLLAGACSLYLFK